MNRWLKIFLLAAAALLIVSGTALAQDAQNITKQCKFKVSSGSTKDLKDGYVGTIWEPKSGKGEMRMMMPESAAYVRIAWGIEPTNYTVTEYDKDLKPLVTHTQETDACPCLDMLYTLQEETVYLSAQFVQAGQGIGEIHVYTDGKLPSTVIEWKKGAEKCDMMIVSTHQDDEWLWFGGLIPYYDLVQKKNVQVVYFVNCGRGRYEEALNGLARAGITTYPVFVGFKNEYIDNLAISLKHWGGQDKVLAALSAVIRCYKPEVIVCQDWNGEYGHSQHRLLSRHMTPAIKSAADATKYPSSANLYGAWQVKKLYRHLSKKQRIQFDWNIPYPELHDHTPLEVAKAAMAQHVSQKKNYKVENHGRYDNSLFGLDYTVVGNDLWHNDMFENIA